MQQRKIRCFGLWCTGLHRMFPILHYRMSDVKFQLFPRVLAKWLKNLLSLMLSRISLGLDILAQMAVTPRLHGQLTRNLPPYLLYQKTGMFSSLVIWGLMATWLFRLLYLGGLCMIEKRCRHGPCAYAIVVMYLLMSPRH